MLDSDYSRAASALPINIARSRMKNLSWLTEDNLLPTCDTEETEFTGVQSRQPEAQA